MAHNPFADMNDEQLDVAFTMLVSAAFGSDPFETEEYLREKGIIGDEPRCLRTNRHDWRTERREDLL